MIKVLMVIVALVAFATGAMAEGKRSFTGVYASLGQFQGGGEFTLSHESPRFSLGTLLDVPLTGSITTYEVGYRFPLGQSNLRFGVNAILHQGSVSGVETWSGYGVDAGVGVSSSLRLSLGGEIGVVLGEQERLYVYAGMGKVATNLSLYSFINTPYGNWHDEKSGGALGNIVRLGVAYQWTDHLAVGAEVSQMKFGANKAFGLEEMGQHTLDAGLKQTMVGVKVTFTF